MLGMVEVWHRRLVQVQHKTVVERVVRGMYIRSLYSCLDVLVGIYRYEFERKRWYMDIGMLAARR